jgi:hypothetical protein
MPDDTDTGRNWLDLLPRENWPEPWASMDIGAPLPRPNDLQDPEQPDDRPYMGPVLVVEDRSAVEGYRPYIKALEALAGHLRVLARDFAEIKEPTAQQKRLAAHLSLVAAIELVSTVWGGRGLSFALVDLMAAITDIEEGRQVDWLTPPPIGGRPAGVPHIVALLRGRYASIVELLHRQGMPIQNAALAVQRAISPDDPVWGSGAASWKAVRKWRDRDAKVAGSPEEESFKAGLALAERFPGADPLQILSCMRRAP